ncbi:hypothetical protein M9Y10_022091 [Tritrichomonas musculus]|uniref:Uncharacterized protein n=1 Tax=Tritrichomonas musculus TaxID=1915356 RepID=A0ABR2KR99_9EUKA
MATSPTPDVIQKVCDLCATEQFDELRQFIPSIVSPDQSVCFYYSKKITNITD